MKQPEKTRIARSVPAHAAPPRRDAGHHHAARRVAEHVVDRRPEDRTLREPSAPLRGVPITMISVPRRSAFSTISGRRFDRAPGGGASERRTSRRSRSPRRARGRRVLGSARSRRAAAARFLEPLRAAVRAPRSAASHRRRRRLVRRLAGDDGHECGGDTQARVWARTRRRLRSRWRAGRIDCGRRRRGEPRHVAVPDPAGGRVLHDDDEERGARGEPADDRGDGPVDAPSGGSGRARERRRSIALLHPQPHDRCVRDGERERRPERVKRPDEVTSPGEEDQDRRDPGEEDEREHGVLNAGGGAGRPRGSAGSSPSSTLPARPRSRRHSSR